MRVISIRQPWASLIVREGKDIENRTWSHPYRGPVLIHASITWDAEHLHEIARRLGLAAGFFRGLDMPRGGIVGVADLVACVTTSPSKWFVGPYGFVLRRVQPLPFTPNRGLVGLPSARRDLLQRLEPHLRALGR